MAASDPAPAAPTLRLPDTRFLRAFYVAGEEGGFGRAAARLHCTQPAVSYQIRTLERELGVALFERGGRRALLTPAGRQLFAFCRRFFAEYDLLAVDLAGGGRAREEPLRVASVAGFGRYVLFPALTGLLQGGERPDAPRLDLRFRTADDVFRLVESGDVDLGVVYLPKVSNHLAFRPLVREELVLVAAPALVERRRGGALAAADLAQLATYERVPFVTYLESEYVFGRWFEAMFGAPPTRTASAHQFDELEEVIAAVALGSGASIVPLDAVRALAARGAVRVLRPVRGRRCENQVYAVTRASGAVRPELAEVLAALSRPSRRPEGRGQAGAP